jgi:hypothetical protein
MANPTQPFGLRPLGRNYDGGQPQTHPYTKAVGYAQAIFVYDPVTLLAGVLNGPASGITAGTTRFLGVALKFSAASTADSLIVVDNPTAIFAVRGDGTGGGGNVISAATMGYNGNLTFGTAGGTVVRLISGAALAESTIATTSTLDVKMDNLLNSPDNAFGVNAVVEVMFNKHLKSREVTVT